MAKREGFNFGEVLQKLQQKQPKLMTALEIQATDHFVGSWRKQGWVDESLTRWKEVKRRMPGTKAYQSARKSARTRSILVKSGALRGGFYTRIKRNNIVQIANSVPYARYHNEGARGTAYVRPHQRFVKSGVFAGTGVYSIKTRKERRVQLEAKQQIGGHSRKVNLPQRQFMGHAKELEKKQIKAITNWINDAIRQ